MLPVPDAIPQSCEISNNPWTCPIWVSEIPNKISAGRAKVEQSAAVGSSFKDRRS
jgi:hypothetical protein